MCFHKTISDYEKQSDDGRHVDNSNFLAVSAVNECERVR